MTLYLTEADVEALLGPEDALEAVEACFGRMAAGVVDNRPRYRVPLGDGVLAVMSAADHDLGYAGLKTYAVSRDRVRFVVLLFESASADLVAVIEANKLGQLRTGAASGVAAKHRVIGCGWQAETQVACIRAAVPTIESVVAYCRSEERLEEFCRRVGAEPAESHREAGRQDVVATVTTSQ